MRSYPVTLQPGLQPEFAKSGWHNRMTSDSTIHIATARDSYCQISKKCTRPKPRTKMTWNTWTAANISDMALGINDHYDWDAASVLVDDATHRMASVQAAFPDKSEDFHHSVQYSRHNALELVFVTTGLGFLTHSPK